MQVEMVLVGMILFGGMIAAGVKIWLNRRQESIKMRDEIEKDRELKNFKDEDNTQA